MILTADELQELTGYKRRTEQRKELAHLGIPYQCRRDGSIVVYRSAIGDRSTMPSPEPALHL